VQKIKIISLLIALIMNHLVYATDIGADGELDKEIQRLQEEKKLWIETVSKQKETKDAAAGVVSVITQDEINRYGGKNLFPYVRLKPPSFRRADFISSHVVCL
jgi:outer membrane receptor for ferrienterochelin and colicin